MAGCRAARVSRRVGLLVAMLAVPFLLAACGDSSKSSTKPGANLGKVVIPKFDPAAPFPAMSGPTLDALAADVPGLAKVKDAVLAAEREAIKGAFDNARAKPKPAAKSKPARKKVSEATPSWMLAADSRSFNLISAAMAGEAGTLTMENLMPVIVANNLIVMAGEAVSNQDTSTGGGSKSVTMPGKEAGTVDASMTLSAETGGPVTAEYATKVDMPLIFLQANSKASITGDLCPDADGKVQFTVKLATDGRAGSGGSSIYDRSVEAKITITVGDDANIVNADVDSKQATRSTAGGRQVYVETSQAMHMPGGNFSNFTMDQLKVIRTSSQATSADEKLANDGHARALMLTVGAIGAAEGHWKGGKCIKIDAASPGTVKPGATSKIPVAVKHRKDGSSVPAKVTVQLTGGASVTPGTIAKAPGEVTHVAVKERQKSMTIVLTAASRRGKDTVELTLSTGGLKYSASGGGTGLDVSGTIDDVSKPFRLKGQGKGFAVDLSYSPSSEKAGSMTYNGTGGGVVLAGGGNYTIAEAGTQGGRPVLTLEAKPTGCVTGSGFKNCRQTHQVVTLTPID